MKMLKTVKILRRRKWEKRIIYIDVMKCSYKGMLAIELTITLGALKEKQIKFCKGSFIFFFVPFLVILLL